ASAAAGLMQQQMHYRAVIGVAEVVRLGVTSAYQITEVVGVLAVGGAVAEDFSRRAEQSHALQIGQGFLQLAQQRLLFVGRLRLFYDWYQFGRDRRFQGKVRVDLGGRSGGE